MIDYKSLNDGLLVSIHHYSSPCLGSWENSFDMNAIHSQLLYICDLMDFCISKHNFQTNFNLYTVPPLLSGPQITGFPHYLAYRLYSHFFGCLYSDIIHVWEEYHVFCPNTHLCLPSTQAVTPTFIYNYNLLKYRIGFTHRATCRLGACLFKMLRLQLIS